MIDDVEVGHQVAPKFRVAFEVADSAEATGDLVAAGAELIAAPRVTPWHSLNARLAAAPAGMQITVFQELQSLEERTATVDVGSDTRNASESAQEQ